MGENLLPTVQIGLKCKTEAQLDQESSKISVITRAHGNFICALKEHKDDDLLENLSSDVTECLQKCSDLYNECRLRICDKSDDKTCKVSDTSEEKIDPEPCNSVSQVDSRFSATSSKSSVVKRIELQKKRAELENKQELGKARKTGKLAEAEAAEAKALAKNLPKLVKRGCWLKSKGLKRRPLLKYAWKWLTLKPRNSCLLVLKVSLQLLLFLKPLKQNLCFSDVLARKFLQSPAPLIV